MAQDASPCPSNRSSQPAGERPADHAEPKQVADLKAALHAEIDRLERQQALGNSLIDTALHLADEGKPFNRRIADRFESAVPGIQVAYTLSRTDYIIVTFGDTVQTADLDLPVSCWIPRGAPDADKWARLHASLTTFQEDTDRALTRARNELACLEKLVAADQKIGQLYAQIARTRHEAESLFGIDSQPVGRRWSVAASAHLPYLTGECPV